MKDRTLDEIKSVADELWGVNRQDVTIKCAKSDGKAAITLSAMYEPPGLTFAQLKRLSEFFETENINDDDKFSHGGCDTCDYGSEYGFTLTIRP